MTARRTFLLLTFTRWFPVGLSLPVLVLLPLQRGLGLAELGVVLAAQGIVWLALELPTGGLADSVGRRPVLVAAGLVGITSGVIYLVAAGPVTFVIAFALQGVYRALDSGPLEAWYVDLVDDPQQVPRTLGTAGAVVGVAIGGGSLIAGGLIAWHPGPLAAMELPYALGVLIMVGHLVATLVLVREPRGLRVGARRAGGTVVGGLRLLATTPVLAALVLTEAFWSIGMVGYESLMPVRAAELVGSGDAAAALMGPLGAVAWGLAAAVSALAGPVGERIGIGWAAVLVKLLNGAFVVAMGLAAGPVGLVAAYLATYALHGAGTPLTNALLHRQATAANRATVLSMGSMVAGGTYTLALLVFTPLAAHASTATAIVVAGAVSMLGAAFYLPAARECKLSL